MSENNYSSSSSSSSNNNNNNNKRKRNNDNDNVIDLINDDDDVRSSTNGIVMTVDLTNDNDDDNIINANVITANDIVNDEVIAQNLQEQYDEEYASNNNVVDIIDVDVVNSEDINMAKRLQDQCDEEYMDELRMQSTMEFNPYQEYQHNSLTIQQNNMFDLLRPMVSSSSAAASFSVLPYEDVNIEDGDNNNEYDICYDQQQQMRNLEDSYTDTIKVLETLVRRVLDTSGDDIITVPDSVRLINSHQLSNEIASFVTAVLNHYHRSIKSSSSSAAASSSSSSSHREIQKFLWEVHTHYSLWSFQYHMQQKHVSDDIINVFQSKKHLDSFCKAKWWFKKLIESLSVKEILKEEKRVTYNINENYLKSTHFISKMIRKVISHDTSDDTFVFDFDYISWGSDSDYSECSSDFINARLYGLNPFQFLAKGLCIICDRLFSESKILNTNTKSNLNLMFCRCTLKLLLQDREYWHSIGWTHVFDAMLNVRGYCYIKLLTVLKWELCILKGSKVVSKKESINKKIEEIEILLINANDDNDITLEYKIAISRAKAEGNKGKCQNVKILSSTVDAWYDDDEYNNSSTSIDTPYIREHYESRITVPTSKRVSFKIEKNHFQNIINISQSSDINSNNISRVDAILSKNRETGYNQYDWQVEELAKNSEIDYGWQVEELAIWRYALLIKGNENSKDDQSIEMVVPYQLLPSPQKGIPHLSAPKLKCKVHKDSINTWVGAFAETRIWIDSLWILMGQEMMTSVPMLTNVRNFQEYPLDWPNCLFDYPDWAFIGHHIHVENKYLWDFKLPATSFYELRKDILDARLEDLRNMDTDTLHQDFQARYESPSCKHKRNDNAAKEEICSFTKAIGGWRLASVFLSILKDPHTYYKGFPDLCFWKTNGDNFNSIHTTLNPKPWAHDTFFAAEVKSVNDKLSYSQEAVNEMLQSAKIHIEVFKVTAPK